MAGSSTARVAAGGVSGAGRRAGSGGVASGASRGASLRLEASRHISPQPGASRGLAPPSASCGEVRRGVESCGELQPSVWRGGAPALPREAGSFGEASALPGAAAAAAMPEPLFTEASARAKRSDELGEQQVDTALTGEPDDVICSGEQPGDAGSSRRAAAQLEVFRLGNTTPPSSRPLPLQHAPAASGAGAWPA
eukprot:scaffold28805_cov63-Phaeocystis_antarctica.AAC.1